MAKKNNAVVKFQGTDVGIVDFVPTGWSLSKDGKTITLSSEFQKEVLGTAIATGNLIQTAKEKARVVLNITLCFDKWKELNPLAGLPRFVHDFLDSKCPVSAGSKGSETDRELKANKTHSGIEYMVKNARRMLKVMDEVKTLHDAGKDVSTEDKIRELKAKARTAQGKTEKEEFCRVMVRIDEDVATGELTVETIEDLLITILKKKVKGKRELSDAGTKLLNEAKTAILVARGEHAKRARNITPKK